MKTFQELATTGTVETLLRDHKNYLAHTPDECLSEHMSLVTHYFLELVRIHNLEPLVDDLLQKLCRENANLGVMAKKIFWETVLYHDFGKINENFQHIKMGNINRFPETKNNSIRTGHSLLSAYIFLCHTISDGFKYLEKEKPKDLERILFLIVGLTDNILRHHSPRLDDISDNKTFKKFTDDLCTELEVYLRCYNVECLPEISYAVASIRTIKFDNLGFEWFLLIRLNFSLLTAADYYATSHYCNQWKRPYNEFGVLTEEQRQRHAENLKTTHKHNETLYRRREPLLTQSLDQLRDKSNSNLNTLRSKMAAETVNNIQQHAADRLFYIEAPTGGGKTNMAFIATTELLQANPELNKVFYVFPFTTLATQTQHAAKYTLGLTEDEYIELHSRAPWKEKEIPEENQDGLYGETRLDDIHNQFVNYPYTFLSHVRFFDILKANEKSSIYLLHRLANSIVVIDEIQAYNPDLWDKMAYLLKEYSDALNIRFIVMSATLPKIGDLAKADFKYLIPDAIQRYFTNPNFSERVSFSNELLQKKKPSKETREDYMEWLAQSIFDLSEDYRHSNGHAHTIVEFIFKRSATEFAALSENLFEDYEIYVLSGTILEPRRKQIINNLKSKFNKNKNVLLITTQVVEAGVDIDMDLGFKNRSIIDSEEQLAGRVNRNVNKQGCKVYLFDLDDASVIYGKDRRFKETKGGIENDYFEILRTKRFDVLYEKVKKWLNKTNEERQLAGTVADYQKLIGQLNFPKIDEEFMLIEQLTVSVFVPLALPLQITRDTGETEAVFTKQQLQFLEGWEIKPKDDYLSGAAIFQLYKQLIGNRSKHFISQKHNLKILQSIMAMFTFSLFSESKVVQELINSGNPQEFGFLYLTSHQKVYSYERGLIDQNFTELIFL